METKDYIDPTIIDETTFNNTIDSSTFDIITNLEINEKKIVISTDNMKIRNSKFIEMPLQINSNQKTKVKQPFLLVEDKGYNNESFRLYEISLIDEKSEKKIKCYRRFSNFDAMNLKLRERYPYLIIPSLPKKNYKVKIIKVEEEFYSNRTRSLKSYLNYIFKHEILGTTQELTKFLNDAEFDEAFFALECISKKFPETDNSKKLSYSGQIIDYFSGFFKTKEYVRVPTLEESQFKKLNSHYSNLYLKYKELKKKLRNSSSYGEMANNFLYLKEVQFETFNNKEYFTKFNETMIALKISLKLYKEEGEKILDKIRVFLRLLQGLIEMFQRWEEFLVLFESVDKTFYMSKSHPKSFNTSAISKEYQKVMDMKTSFIKSIIKEVSEFCTNNKDIYNIIIEEFKKLINVVNTNEKTKLSIIENYF